ncbi:phage tail protein [Paenibacillus sp. NPDC058367]|uniref:phage tail protein n=1 Tax=Paenibacillus sp. NPDC058367 TaxID=3346460 RepID=UPI003650B79D
MPIASYQGKTFSVSPTKVYTIDGLEWSGSLNTESQEKLKSKPSTYVKGQGLDTMSFDVPLRAELKVDVRKEIEAWEALREKASPAFFVLGTKPLGKNKWLLKSVAITETQIDGKGRLIAARIKLGFEEYVRAGSAQKAAASASTKKTSAKSKKSNTAQVNLNLVPMSYIDKVETKRVNPNAATARRNAVEAKLNSMGV